MGLLGSLLKNKDLLKNVSALAGNENIMKAVSSLTANKELMNNLASAKDDNQFKELISTAVDALKDMNLSDAEKKELIDKAKDLIQVFGKKK